jgi:cation:H+ antiporter
MTPGLLLGTLVYFGLGLILVVYFAERLVKGTLGTALGFGVSSFLVSVVFIGFDPENLAVGAVGAAEGMPGIALGSIIGAAMVAIGLAFGLTALLCPMRYERTPPRILAVPLLAVGGLWVLSMDGRLSRLDGMLLFLGYGLAVLYLRHLARRGVDVRPAGEVAEELEDAKALHKWKALGLLLVSLVGLVVGSELLVIGSERAITWLKLSDTVFGMTILALAVSIEEFARELPAAWRGRPEISFGNVVGSILAFFLFNGGVIAMVRPVAVEAAVLHFYLPMCLGTVVVISAFMLTNHVPRWGGALLVALYGLFFAGAYWPTAGAGQP